MKRCCVAFLLLFAGCVQYNPYDALNPHYKLRYSKAVDDLELTVQLNPQDMTYTVFIANLSHTHYVRAYDPVSKFSIYRHYSGPSAVRVRDQSGKLLSDIPESKDGWWTELITQSQARHGDEGFVTLLPRQAITGTFPIEATLFTLKRHDEIPFDSWRIGKSIKLQVFASYMDPKTAEEKDLTLELPWIELTALDVLQRQ
jgi:hypothetical protein